MGVRMRGIKEENGRTEKWRSAVDTQQPWPKDGLRLSDPILSHTSAVWYRRDTSIGY